MTKLNHSPHLSRSRKLIADECQTPLGQVLIISDDNVLHFLQFLDTPGLEKKINHLKKQFRTPIQSGTSKPILLLKQELSDYFSKGINQFQTPIALNGTEFQKKVWHQLCVIPFGSTRSYQEISTAIEKPKSYRAVAQANRSNSLMIIIPCHRVVYSNGDLGGYSGKTERKQWLLEHESQAVE